ncbi:GNAT family N-acetyltransferase [Chitinophaga sp. 22321]|uniref:GNAT family N-acetyltransferase n=1 Tax=Chitinophaga hostae TaxID=2831022 RepID=A0ABS5J2C0_9BACT|nr:GNAT family N-acetyltransferase [Chitinophaga hostae]MBS0029349.1 GNAT family N-acetyltransferase [Chitinophaga hostae]
MIDLVPVSIADEVIKRLYEDAFPKEERRPWDWQLALIATGELRVLRIARDGLFAGFVFYWQLPAFAFIEHFAVHPDARGGGAGTRVMELLEKELGTIILEVEPPITEQAIRRVKFYERLGYTTFPDTYQQPSYYPEFPPLALRLMYKGLPSALNFNYVRHQLYRYVYKQ